MKSLFDYDDVRVALPTRAVPQPHPGVSWQQARVTARALMSEQARRHGFALHGEDNLAYDAQNATFRYRVFSDRDLSARHAGTSLWFDANSGEFPALEMPTAMATAIQSNPGFTHCI